MLSRRVHAKKATSHEKMCLMRAAESMKVLDCHGREGTVTS